MPVEGEMRKLPPEHMQTELCMCGRLKHGGSRTPEDTCDGTRRQSDFGVHGEERSSSPAQTGSVISHSRCVDYLFNWVCA